MIQHLHHLYFPKNFLQIVLIQLTLVDDFDGDLVRKNIFSKRETEAVEETKKHISASLESFTAVRVFISLFHDE